MVLQAKLRPASRQAREQHKVSSVLTHTESGSAVVKAGGWQPHCCCCLRGAAGPPGYCAAKGCQRRRRRLRFRCLRRCQCPGCCAGAAAAPPGLPAAGAASPLPGCSTAAAASAGPPTAGSGAAWPAAWGAGGGSVQEQDMSGHQWERSERLPSCPGLVHNNSSMGSCEHPTRITGQPPQPLKNRPPTHLCLGHVAALGRHRRLQVCQLGYKRADLAVAAVHLVAAREEVAAVRKVDSCHEGTGMQGQLLQRPTTPQHSQQSTL